MGRRVSIKDVAARAGVSWKTVSNVVNERPVVRPETRERVERAIADLGYVPNRAGLDLRGGSTRAIALVLPELANPYFAILAERIQEAARRRGYTVSVELTLGDREVEIDHLRGRTARPVDAVILSPMRLEPRDIVERQIDVPVVLLGESIPAGDGVFHVAIDNAASAVDVVRHLVDQGRSRLLFLGAQRRPGATGAQRMAGFRAAARFAGLAEDPRLILPAEDWGRDAGREALAVAMANGVEFDAVVAGNDLLAIGALSALRDAGRDVPGDVAVVGWDDDPESRFSVPPLTSVAPDLEALVTAALDAAVGPVGGDQPGSTNGVDGEIVVRHELRIRGSSMAAEGSGRARDS